MNLFIFLFEREPWNLRRPLNHSSGPEYSPVMTVSTVNEATSFESLLGLKFSPDLKSNSYTIYC